MNLNLNSLLYTLTVPRGRGRYRGRGGRGGRGRRGTVAVVAPLSAEGKVNFTNEMFIQ